MRALLCRLGFHSLTHTCGSWGCTQTCNHCPFVTGG